MNNLNNYPFQSQQTQQLYMQPQGLMYIINNSNDLNNIPLNTINIIALCLSENKCYIRTIQNGVPVITTYTLNQQNEQQKEEIDLVEIVKKLESRITKLETSTQKGGRLDEFL